MIRLLHFLAIALFTSSMVLVSAVSRAEETIRFSCTEVDGVLATIADTPQGTTPIVFWNSPEIDTSEMTPAELCETAAQRFQAYGQEPSFPYITTGRLDRRPVVCLADYGGGCIEPLFALRPGELGDPGGRPPLQLGRILRVRVVGDRPVQETGCRIYVSLDHYLSGDESAATCPSPP
jgi:hypothetical protein